MCVQILWSSCDNEDTRMGPRFLHTQEALTWCCCDHTLRKMSGLGLDEPRFKCQLWVIYLTKLRFPPLSFLCCCCYCLVAKLCPTLLRPHGLQPTSLLCPWDFPGEHSGVGCHFLLQGVFLTQGLKLHLLHWQKGSLPASHQRTPWPWADRSLI